MLAHVLWNSGLPVFLRENGQSQPSGGEYAAGVRRVFPPINASASADAYVITVELPGFDPEKLEVTAFGDTLTIKGEKKVEQLPEGVRYHRRERMSGMFERSVRFPFAVNAESVKASAARGVLTLTVPMPEVEKPKRITIRNE